MGRNRKACNTMLYSSSSFSGLTGLLHETEAAGTSDPSQRSLEIMRIKHEGTVVEHGCTRKNRCSRRG